MKTIRVALVISVALILMRPCQGLTVVAPSFQSLVAQAEQIVRVRVTAVTSAWDDSGGMKRIHTYVACQVIRTLKGDPAETVTLRLLGGQVGEVSMTVTGMPTFEVGGTYILFVARNGTAFCPLVGVMHGSYRVTRDPATGAEHIRRSNSEPLNATRDVEKPMGPAIKAEGAADTPGMTREDFETAILNQLGHASSQ